MKKKILLIGNYPPPFGGVPHHIERLSSYLADQGWNCHVLSGGISGVEQPAAHLTIYKPSYPRKLLGLIRQWNHHHLDEWLDDGSLDTAEPQHWRRYKMYADVGTEIVQRHDIQVVGSYNLLSYAPVGAYLSERFGIPHIINIFGEIYKYPSMQSNSAFFRRVAMNAISILSCSAHCARSAKMLGYDSEVKAVNYGVDIRHFSPGAAPTDLRGKYGLGYSPVVLFVGRLGREMGADIFLASAKEIWKSMPEVCFIMVGQNDDLADELEIESAQSVGQLVLVRNVSYDDLPKYYRLANVVVVPTRGDRTCSSLAAMEAMATRKPVVAFAIGGIPEIVEHEKTGLLVEPANQPELVKAVKRLLVDGALGSSLAAAAYEQARECFDEKIVNAKMERHYLNAMGMI